MKFGELKQILTNSRDVIICDGDGERLTTYDDVHGMDEKYDECDAYRLDIEDGKFLVFVDLPTWRVSGTITIDIEFTVSAIDEDDAISHADDLFADTSGNTMRIASWGDIEVYLGDPDFDWDGAEAE